MNFNILFSSKTNPYQVPISTLSVNGLNFPRLQNKQQQNFQQQSQFQSQHLKSQLDVQKNFYFKQNTPFFNPQQIYNLKKVKKKNCLTIEEGCDEHLSEKTPKKLFLCFDEFGNIEFSPQFMRRFHWISQVNSKVFF